MFTARPLLPALALTLAACSVRTWSGPNDTPPSASASAPQPNLSTAYTTSQLDPSMSAQADDKGIRVYGALTSGGEFLQLGEGDYLTAKAGSGEALVLVKEQETNGQIHYAATLPPATSETDVTISFVRASGRTSAPASTVSVPAPFAITSSPPATVQYGSMLSITIAPAPTPSTVMGDFMTVDVTGTCVRGNGPYPVIFDDQGSATFDTGMLTLTSKGCDVTVQVRHQTLGTYDRAFVQGSASEFEGFEARSFTTTISAR